MNKFIKWQSVACAVAMMVGACMQNKITTPQAEIIKTDYRESSEDFPNPERGFYKYSQAKASNFTPLTAEQLNAWTQQTKPANGNYSVYTTLVFRYYVLDIFKDKPVTASFIDAVNKDFEVARKAGFKLIPRFTYTLTQKAGSCPEGFICPPYGDAPKAIVLGHIAQLRKVLHDNADVIAVVQMGFIGVWGEQYYTDYFGDASQNTPVGKLLDQHWQDRMEVLKALLDAVPEDRMVQVRYPQIKQRFVYGINAEVTSLPLQESEAFTETDKARIGFHNDCFLASETDYGTYEDYGNSSTPRAEANTVMRNFKKMDARFVAVGGETCSDSYSPQNDCEPLGRAQAEMKEMHFSYLNSDYNNEVNNDWQAAGCMDSIKRNLGYRLVLKETTFPKSVPAGGSLRFSLVIENRGYASPYNKRPLHLVLRNKADRTEIRLTLMADVRKWFSGAHEIDESIRLPSNAPSGHYDLFLSLPDPYTSIATRPEFAIRLANEDVWEPATGYNKLNATLEIL